MHHYVGLMSGTSVDGIDAALVSISDDHHIQLLATQQHALPEEVRAQILALMAPGSGELDREGELDMCLGRLFAEATQALLAKSGKSASQIRAIGSHGQTLRHRPNARWPFTRQVANPSVIAEITGITTVADFRSRDLAAGGQGAPLVPAFHAAMFQKTGTQRAIVNIGGIANVTWLPGDVTTPVTGFDTGPGNTLLDQWNRRHRGTAYDADGSWAADGRVVNGLLERLQADPFFAAPPPKSTGREHFNSEWLEANLRGSESPADVQATLAALTARTIGNALARWLPRRPEEVYVCGGGAHNRDLIRRLQAVIPESQVATTEALGLDPDWVEAAAFAWLAHRTLSGHPGNLPSVTGARHAAVLGGIYVA